jgi:outer membrane cobalamin receptor
VGRRASCTARTPVAVNILTKRGAGDLGGRAASSTATATRKIDAALSGGSDRGDYCVSVTDLHTDGFKIGRHSRRRRRREEHRARSSVGTRPTSFGFSSSRATSTRRRCTTGATRNVRSVNDCSATTDQTTYRLSADYDSGELTNISR